MVSNIPTNAELVTNIKSFCDRFGMGYSTFGKRAVNDGSLVANLDAGRSPTMKILTRIDEAMRQIEREFEPVEPATAIPD